MPEESQESLILTKPGGRTKQFGVVSEEEIPLGYNPKKKVELSIGERGLSLVVKHLFSQSFADKNAAAGKPLADRYIEMWEEMKKAGLPVVETVRIASDKDVAMTDLTRYGDLYGKHTSFQQGVPPTSEQFLQLNIEEIKTKAEEVAKMAASNDIILPFDDPMVLLVSPQGNWRLIVLDIESGYIKCKHPQDPLCHTIEEENLAYVYNFCNRLRELQNQLRTQLGRK
jgi:hypothetical protein